MKGQIFYSVWDAIEDTPQQAANLQARSVLMMELEKIIQQQRLSQPEAARRFGVTQPRIAELLQGKIHRFSLEALMDMAAAAGLFPRMVVDSPNRQAA
jgi:predicted XRE-type DNA-binding protein